jgi:predicted kinase
MPPNVDAIVDRLKCFFEEPAESSRVIMLCGIAGSGKSTLAKAIVNRYPSFHRLSTDQIIYEIKGIYGVDYPPSEYEELQTKAKRVLGDRFLDLIRRKQDIVLDRSFWAEEDRRECYELFRRERVLAHKLVYLRAEKTFLWNRIQERRRQGVNADSALEITEELFERYCSGFQAPREDENPEIIDVN